MVFCTNCGNKIDESASFCTRCGTAVNNEFVNQKEETQQMYEEFIPTLGLGKRFVFTENSLIFGDKEYAYSELSPITLVTAATFLSNGVAKTKTENGITLTLGYNHKDNERFAIALTFANKQIDIAKGNAKNYKYILQSPSGSKIEVYDDYITLYYVKSGSTKGSESVNAISKGFGMSGDGLSGKIAGKLGKALDGVGGFTSALGNATKGGATGNIIMFTDLNIQLDGDTLIINEYSIPIGQQNIDLAREIIAYIKNTLESAKKEPKSSPIEQEIWEPIKGKSMTFSFYGEVLVIPENLDIFNSYRLKFRELAEKCVERAKSEYKSRVNDFVSFMEFFPKIYKDNLSPIVQKAVDILISEGDWTVTVDSFFDQHTSDFHLGLDDYNVMLESARLTVEKNQKSVASAMSNVPNLVGGGFGFKGALKGMAIAETFNAVKRGVGNNAMKNASSINHAQQDELYGRIKTDILFNRIFADYWNVYHSLVWILKQKGHDIWWQTKDVDQQAKNIFKNLSNPNFPQNKVLPALISLILTNPYSPEYYEFAISRFGQSDEIDRIKKYFGYAN